MPLHNRRHHREFWFVLPPLPHRSQLRMLGPTLILLVSLLLAMVTLAIELLRVRRPLSFALSAHQRCYGLVLLCREKFPIFLQQSVYDCRGLHVVLGLQDTDLHIVPTWCTIE